MHLKPFQRFLLILLALQYTTFYKCPGTWFVLIFHHNIFAFALLTNSNVKRIAFPVYDDSVQMTLL